MTRSVLFTSNGDVDLDGAYSKAIASRTALDEKLSLLVDAKQAKRLAEDRLTNLETDLAMQYRAENPDMSQTQFDKQVRWAIHKNPDWIALRDEITRLAGEVDSLDADRSILKKDVETHNARMIGAGGLLFFLGAEKLAVE